MTEYSPRRVTIVDPRTFDGDPFQVAERACLQAAALTEIATEQMRLAGLMVRNAEMERQIIDTGEPDAAAWEASVQAKTLKRLIELSTGVSRRLGILAQAAGFNPKAPLPKDD